MEFLCVSECSIMCRPEWHVRLCVYVTNDDVIARWPARRTASIIQRPGTWTIVWARLWAPCVWQMLPTRLDFWRVWVRCQWTVQHILVELLVRRHCSQRTLDCSRCVSWTLPRPTWLSMTWTLHWVNCRPSSPTTTWLCVLSSCHVQLLHDCACLAAVTLTHW